MGEEILTYNKRKQSREQSRNLLYPMMTQTSLPILVTALYCQKLIILSLFCQIFSVSRDIFHLYLSAIVLNSLSNLHWSIIPTCLFIIFHTLSYSFTTNNKAEKSLKNFPFSKLHPSLTVTMSSLQDMSRSGVVELTILLAKPSGGLLELWGFPSWAASWCIYRLKESTWGMRQDHLPFPPFCLIL